MGKWNHTIYNILKCFIFYHKICLGDLSMLVHIDLLYSFLKIFICFYFCLCWVFLALSSQPAEEGGTLVSVSSLHLVSSPFLHANSALDPLRAFL